MAVAEYDGYSYYRKSAWRRLRDAEELLASPTVSPHEQGASVRHLRGAIYLAGYAVECALKAYLISREPPAQSLEQVLQRWSDGGRATPKLLGAEGHNLFLLVSLTDLELPLQSDFERKKDWGICLRWRSTWRYDPEPPRPEFAAEFVAAVRRVVEWIVARTG